MSNIGTPSHAKNISDMPKRRKSSVMILNRYRTLHKRLIEVEQELSEIMDECPKRTSCYLRYGWMFANPYAHGHPHKGAIKHINGKLEYTNGIEEWQMILARFYEERANKVIHQRDDLLKKLYRLASRYYNLTHEVVPLSWRFGSHYRKPWFKKGR